MKTLLQCLKVLVSMTLCGCECIVHASIFTYGYIHPHLMIQIADNDMGCLLFIYFITLQIIFGDRIFHWSRNFIILLDCLAREWWGFSSLSPRFAATTGTLVIIPYACRGSEIRSSHLWNIHSSLKTSVLLWKCFQAFYNID